MFPLKNISFDIWHHYVFEEFMIFKTPFILDFKFRQIGPLG